MTEKKDSLIVYAIMLNIAVFEYWHEASVMLLEFPNNGEIAFPSGSMNASVTIQNRKTDSINMLH